MYVVARKLSDKVYFCAEALRGHADGATDNSIGLFSYDQARNLFKNSSVMFCTNPSELDKQFKNNHPILIRYLYLNKYRFPEVAALRRPSNKFRAGDC